MSGDLERVIREQLAVRDQSRAARLFHPQHYAAADEAFIGAVLAAAGLAPADGGKTLRRARKARQQGEDQAFEGKAS